MSPFSSTTPLIRPVDERWGDFRIEESFTYADRKTARTVTIPAGFITDFASIPRAVRWRINKIGRHALAAVVHDWFYRGGRWDDGTDPDRGEADRVLRDASDDLGVGFRDRWLLWSGVKVGGWAAWRKKIDPMTQEA